MSRHSLAARLVGRPPGPGLGTHWVTDVLAGLALGWAWFALCAIAFGGRLLRFGAPVEAAERVEALAGPE